MTIPTPVGYNQGKRSTPKGRSLLNCETYPQNHQTGGIPYEEAFQFTACGGGGGGNYGTRDADKEASLFTSVKGGSQVSAQVTANDPTLCETADRHLKEDLNSSVDFLGAKLVANVHVDGEKDQYLIITATANYIGGPLSELTLKKIEKLAGKKLPGTDVNVRGIGSWIDVGVVVRNVGTQSYMAVAFKIANPKYNK